MSVSKLELAVVLVVALVVAELVEWRWGWRGELELEQVLLEKEEAQVVPLAFVVGAVERFAIVPATPL